MRNETEYIVWICLHMKNKNGYFVFISYPMGYSDYENEYFYFYVYSFLIGMYLDIPILVFGHKW